jgi:hypothetical protein
VRIEVTADFDGVLEAPEGNAEMAALWRAVEERTEEELMNEVAQHLSFTLCKPCRDEWVLSPLGQVVSSSRPAAGPWH